MPWEDRPSFIHTVDITAYPLLWKNRVLILNMTLLQTVSHMPEGKNGLLLRCHITVQANSVTMCLVQHGLHSRNQGEILIYQ